MPHFRSSLLVVWISCLPAVCLAQARDARAVITIVDMTGAILPGATVTITPQEAGATAVTATTDDGGVATISSLKPGRYTITAEFPGFDAGELTDVRMRAGDNKHRLELELTSFTDTVEVGQDAQAAAADPNGSLATTLTDEEIEALSDDPEILMQQLVEMVGGAARIRIDGFNDGSLPSRDVIRSIRIVRDTFPAENHSANNDGIDIITQAGIGPIRGGLSTRVRDSVFNGSNPFVDVKAPERTQNFDANIGGTIVPNKSSFSFFMGRRNQYDTPVATFTTEDGKQSRLLGRRPTEGWNARAMLDYALSTSHILRLGYSQNTSSRSNQGIGGFDLQERAYSSESSNHEFRVQEAGSIGQSAYFTTRFETSMNRNQSVAALEAPTIRVLDGFTSGGAQVRGGTHQNDWELSSDLNYVRGKHTIRTGIQVEGRHNRNDTESNYLGTFIFSSTEDFENGKPRNYTRRIGDPLIVYSHVMGAAYVQDDFRIRQNLTFSPGLRYELQTHVHDLTGFGPRLGLTWAPGKNGRTSIRTSYGIFYNWLSAGTYEQTLRVNGVRQQEINIVNPTYPEVVGEATVSATNKYLLGDLKMERIHRYSLGIDRSITPKMRTSLSFSMARYSHQLRGRNLNAPVDGVRPDPAFANIIEVVPDASNHSYDVVPDFSINFAGGIRNSGEALWNPRRTTIRFNYRHHRGYNNTDGAFSVPPSGSLDDQWGPAGGDTRHRFRASISTQAYRNFNANLSWDANSGAPYTITTGTDDNGDSIFNDRPADTPRNSVRLPWRSTLSANFSYTIRLGDTPGPDAGRRGGPRRRQKGITISMNAQNLTNRANYSGFSGVMTSQYFMQATNVSNPRQIDFSLRFNF